MNRKPRFSHQREAISNIILEDGGHLTAEDIFAKARKKIPSISLGTVYRNLTQLENLRLISKTQGANQVTYYEPYSDPHHHFICEGCFSICNLDNPTVKICNMCVTTTSQTPFKINHVAMTLYGLCENCKLTSEETEVAKRLIKLRS